MDLEDVGKIIRHVIGELFHEWLQRGVGRGAADARPQEQIDDRGAPRIPHQLQREIDVTATPCETRRRDAHDLKVSVIELQRAAQYVRIGQVMFPPESVGKKCNRLRILAVNRVGWPKSASQQRRHAEILKAIRDQAHGRHVLRKILPGQHQSVVVHRQNAFDHGRLPQGLNLGAVQKHRVPGTRYAVDRESYNSICCRVRIRTHQRRMNDAEHSGGRSNAKRQRDHCRQCESWTLDELTCGIAEVLKQSVHGPFLAVREMR